MTDEPLPYGLGAIESLPDERDWSIEELYAATGVEPVDAVPAAYTAPAPYPPVLNQHSTPMCVAYSSSTLKAYEDLRDTGPADFNEPLFFRLIGGTAAGAVVRNALDRMLTAGYPLALVGEPLRHRIAAYYAVPVTRSAITQAILAFGPVLLSVRWPYSWFHPGEGGVLPAPNTIAGGHAIVAIGWDARGLRIRNSWGTAWGLGGDAFIGWDYLGQVREVWKAVDRIVPPPLKPWRLHIAARTTVRIAAVTRSGRISGWESDYWPKPSSAPSRAAVIKRGTRSGQATVTYVKKGMYAGRWVRVGHGVTVTRG